MQRCMLGCMLLLQPQPYSTHKAKLPLNLNNFAAAAVGERKKRKNNDVRTNGQIEEREEGLTLRAW